MTLQQPPPRQINLSEKNRVILCHKCGAPIVFPRDQLGPKDRKVLLDPYFNNEPHTKYCMYFIAPSKPDLEPLLFHFLSKIPNHKPRRIIGAIGRAF